MSLYKHFLSAFKLSPDYDNRVFGLDLMRAIAIISVVIGHGIMLEQADTNFPWIKLIDGVELFFVLSGFLIGGILIKTFHQEDKIRLVWLKNFWIRRWFRTLPNYYLVLLLNILVVTLGIIKEDINQFNWRFLLFLQNFNRPLVGFFWESWSLSIEEWFYILFPIALFVIYYTLKWFKTSKKMMFLFAIILFLFTSFLLRYFIASTYQVDDFWLSVKVFKVVVFRLDGIALGLLAAYIKHWFPNIWSKSRFICFITGIVICYTILCTNWEANDFSTKVFKIMWMSIGCALLLPLFDNMKKAPKLVTKVVTHISLISYSMYLINLALVAEVIYVNFPIHTHLTAWLSYFAYWIIVIIGSTLMYKYFEKPVTNLRERFS